MRKALDPVLRATPWRVVFLAGFLAACGSTPGPGPERDSGPALCGESVCTPATTDAGEVDAGTADAGTTLHCQLSCSTAQDCPPANATDDDDADNWQCNEGRCQYLGCHSSSECRAGSTCVAGASGVPSCVPTCGADAGCGDVYGTFGAVTCVSSLCVSEGCQSTAECAAHLGSHYGCVGTRDGLPTCEFLCSTDADCLAMNFPLPLVCNGSYCVGAPCDAGDACPSAWGRTYACLPAQP